MTPWVMTRVRKVPGVRRVMRRWKIRLTRSGPEIEVFPDQLLEQMPPG